MPKPSCCLKLKEIIRGIKRYSKDPKFLKDKDQNREVILLGMEFLLLLWKE